MIQSFPALDWQLTSLSDVQRATSGPVTIGAGHDTVALHPSASVQSAAGASMLHALQLGWPTTIEYFPTGQTSCVVLPAAQKDPAGQGTFVDASVQ